MIKKNFCYNLHNISYEINLATRFHETTCNSNIAIEVQPFGYFHTSPARHLFNFWNLTTQKNLEPSLFVVFNSITKVFLYTIFYEKNDNTELSSIEFKTATPPPPFPIMFTCVDCGGSRVAQSLPSKYCVLCHVCTLLDDEVWIVVYI